MGKPRRRRQKPKPRTKRAGPGRPKRGETLADRIRARIKKLREAMIALAESEGPGSPHRLREWPAIEAELWALEAQLAAELNDYAKARKCTADAVRWQDQARKAVDFDSRVRLDEIEARLGRGSGLGEAIDHLR